jgi:prepilin-type N-terminal cleavage/methylation domain-containing protein
MHFKMNTKNKGFTLIEIILYMSLLAILLTAFTPFMLQLIKGGEKASSGQDVYSTARYISERIKFEIRNSNGIYAASSTFNANLATTTGAIFSIIGDSPNNPTVFTVSTSTGTLFISQGASAPVALNPSSTAVSNLTFSNNSSADNKSKNFRFTITVKNSGGKGQEYEASTTIVGSAEVRSN